MAHRMLTLEEFREDFGGNSNDASLAVDIVSYLDPASAAGLVLAAREFLEAQSRYEVALVAAKLRID